MRAVSLSFVLAAGVSSCAREPAPVEVNLAPPAPKTSPSAVTIVKPRPVVVPLVEGPPAPPKSPVDPALKVDGAGLLLAATPSEAWLAMDGYSVVVDRASHCVTESYRGTPVLRALRGASSTEEAAAQLKRPEVVAAVRDLVGLARRFGRGTPPYFELETAFDPAGRTIYVATSRALFRSGDGGRSFTLAEPFYAGRPAVTADGQHVVYERCTDDGCTAGREWVSAPTDASAPPATLTRGQTMFFGTTADSKARFTRAGSDVCLDTFSLADATPPTSVCVPLPKAVTGPWPAHEWQAVSPSGNYGIVKWEEGRKIHGVVGLTYVVSLVEMRTSRIVKTVLDLRGDVDDQGNMVMQSMSEGGGDHTYFLPIGGGKKLLGNHSLADWDGKTALLSVWKKSTLGARRCDLLSFVPAP